MIEIKEKVDGTGCDVMLTGTGDKLILQFQALVEAMVQVGIPANELAKRFSKGLVNAGVTALDLED